MLRRAAALAAALLVGAAMLAAPASADAPECAMYNPKTGHCDIVAGGGGSDGGGAAQPQGGGNTEPVANGDVPSPVITVDGTPCIFGGRADPQPPATDDIWAGHTDGAIYVCVTTRGAPLEVQTTLMFWAAAPPAAPAPPDPAVLAQQAVKTMNLRAIGIGIVPEPVPGRVGIIGLPTWMWAADPGESTTGPITRTASAAGYTVTATARLQQIVWTMGDGSTVTCYGAGTPYADEYGRSPSPDCGHTYTKQGHYTVNATSYWTVAWSGIGETGTIPLDFTDSTAITMGEAQVLTR